MESNSTSKLSGLIYENIRATLVSRFGTMVPFDATCQMLKKNPSELRALFTKKSKVEILDGRSGGKRRAEYIEAASLAKWLSASRNRATRFAVNVYNRDSLPDSQVDALLIGSPLFKTVCRKGHHSVRSTWTNTCLACAEERRLQKEESKTAVMKGTCS